MSVAELLVEKYDFGPDLAAEIGDLAASQARSFGDYGAFLESVGANNLTTKQYDGYKPLQVLDIRPKDYDPRRALLVNVAMANSLDPNQRVQIATIASANPGRRILAYGNPGAPAPFKTKSRLLKLHQIPAVAGGNFSATTDPILKHLNEEGIEVVDQYGYSYGEVATTDIMQRADQETGTALVYDTARAVDWVKKWKLRGGLRLLGAFNSTGEPMQDYVEESGFEPYLDARADSPQLVGYVLGVARPSNIAVGLGITGSSYVEETTKALNAQPNAKYVAGWGTKSEFNIDGVTERAVETLSTEFGSQVVLRPVDAHHSGANNIYLQAALVKEALGVAS
jgi:hypothetical protein